MNKQANKESVQQIKELFPEYSKSVPAMLTDLQTLIVRSSPEDPIKGLGQHVAVKEFSHNVVFDNLMDAFRWVQMNKFNVKYHDIRECCRSYETGIMGNRMSIRRCLVAGLVFKFFKKDEVDGEETYFSYVEASAGNKMLVEKRYD